MNNGETVTITGTICTTPMIKTTSLGRTISRFIVVTVCGEYIPCVLNERFAISLNGEIVTISGQCVSSELFVKKITKRLDIYSTI